MTKLERTQQSSVLKSKQRPPVAVLGYCMDLPSMPHLSGDDLARVLQNRETLFQDYLDAGIIDPREYSEEGNPWMIQHRKGHKHTSKRLIWDKDLLQVSEKESKFMSDAQLIALHTTMRGLEHSGVPISLLHKTRTGVFVAATTAFGDFKSYPDETSLRGGLSSSISDRVAYFLGTHGPTLTVETACSSSLVALSIAVDSLRNGSCDVAIVATVNGANLEYELSLQATGVISLKGECKPFDENASGTLRCEGCGCTILCTMEWAERHGYCGSIRGLVVNATVGSAGADPNAAHGSGRVYESPNVFGMAEMIRLCHEQVGLPLEKIQYVEAHATGTKVGDLVELEALCDVYKDSHDISRNPLRVGSVKGNIGHAEISAGMFSLIKVLEMLRTRTFFPTGGGPITPRTDFDWDGNNIKLCQDTEPFPADEIFIGVNSFGVGGSYAHAVVTGYAAGGTGDRCLGRTAMSATGSPVSSLLLTVSAASTRHLDEYERCLAEYLHDNDDDVSLLDLCGLFALNRSTFSFSRSYVADSLADLSDQLSSASKGKAFECSEHQRTVALAFTGQGSQWVSMGCGLMVFDAYRDVVTRFDALYRPLCGWSPLDKLTSLHGDELADTMYAQPLTFMVQVGLIELLRYFGVPVKVCVGHSAGEIAALYCCGMLSLSESAKVVFHRSHCQQALAGCGRMLAVQMTSADARSLLKDASLGLTSCEVACINSPSSVVLAGPHVELERVREYLASKRVKNTFLKGNTAFHCSLMDPILCDVDDRLSFLNGRKSRHSDTKLISTVTGLPQSMLRSEYIVHNIRQPVRFHEAIRYLLDHFDPDVIVEIGPHKTLAPLLVECMAGSHQQARVLTSLTRAGDDVRCFWHLIMDLLIHGVCVDVGRCYRDLGYRFSNVAGTNIPGHPIIPKEVQTLRLEQRTKLHGKLDVGPACGTFESDINRLVSVVEITTATCSPMADHVMGGIAILPGMYFVEAAIEAWRLEEGDCVSLSDVTFHEMCPIPDRMKNQEPRKLVVRHSAEKSHGLTDFTVESITGQSSNITVHCTGKMTLFARPDLFDGLQYIPGNKGFKEKRQETRDIGEEGIRNLLDSHHSICSDGTIYQMINEHGVTEYGPSFQIIDDVRVRAGGSSIVTIMEFDHQQWHSKGGSYGVQLLDAILQLGFLNPYIPSGNVGYAGGFDLGIFVRKPVQNPCIVHFQFVEDKGSFGQTVSHGEALMYDPNGLLICHLIGIKAITGKGVTKLCDAMPVWQPMSMIASDILQEASPMFDSKSIAALVATLLQQRHESMHEATHARILEYWEDSSCLPPVFDALSKADRKVLPTDFSFLVEVFIATHEDHVLENVYQIPPKHRQWLRVRLVSLPSGQESLSQLCFDVIAAWRRGSGPDMLDNPMRLVEDASVLGYAGSVLVHDLDVGDKWDGYVAQTCHHPGGFSSCVLLSRALIATQSERRTVYIVSCDESVSSQVHDAVDDVAREFDANISVKARLLDCRDQQGICDLAGEIALEPGETHVVVLHGVVDDSEYSQDTFILVARLAQQMKVAQTTCFLWVITKNAFVAPINVHRGSLLPLVIGVNATVLNVSAKFVDHLGPDRSLASLILSNPGPQQFMIDATGIVHQRIVLPCDIGRPPRRVSVRSDDSDTYYKCELVKPGQSSKAGSYDFFAHKVMPPGVGEVLVDIKYASLNFRDVMLTLNALPRSSFEASYFGYNLGMEASGIVVEVGEGVSHLAPGDRVAVSGKGTLASKLTVPDTEVVKLEAGGISLQDAACLSSVYSTAYHALVELSQIRAGERVLIHAAAGGVGHAAVCICSTFGAEVYATCSQAKREYCMNVLGVAESRLFSSRDVGWFDDVMRATGDEGVDVVLNSLAGEHQRLGVQCLRPGGRFCEIGKADIFNNEKLSLFAFRKNIRLFAIDMDRMAFDDVMKTRNISQIVFNGANRGDYVCLPSTCFPMDRIKDAIEFMKSGAHIGKVVLSNASEDGPLTVQCNHMVQFSDTSFHLIVGGAGGFGSKMVRWLHKKGARKFIITVSKNPSRILKLYEDLIEDGTAFEVVEVDLSSRHELEKLECAVMGHPVLGDIETMVHCAGIYEPFFIEDISDDALKLQCDIKVQSALFLDQLSRKLDSVKHFMIVGSNSSDIVFPTFLTYSASNAILGSIARRREHEGLPVTILHMGSLKDVGIVAKDLSTVAYQRKTGAEFLNSARAVLAFENMLSDGTNEMVHMFYVSYLHSKNMALGWAGGFSTPIVDSLLVFGETKQSSRGVQASYDTILERVIWMLTDTLGIDQATMTASSSLASMGIDSLAILEFRQHILDEFDYAVDRSAFAMSVADLSREIYNKVKDVQSTQAEVKNTDAGQSMIHQSPEEDENEVQGKLNMADEGTYLKCTHVIENPRGYAILFPGADQKLVYFADWKKDDVQLLFVDLQGSSFDPKMTAKKIALEMHMQGYLKDYDTKIVLLGYSFGAFLALETCKELLDVYSFHPAGLIPMCFAAPHMCMSRLHRLPGVMRRVMMKKVFKDQVKREYGEPDPDDTIAYSAYLQRPSYDRMCTWAEEGLKYFKMVQRDLQLCPGFYIGDVRVHYICAVKDQIGNPKRIPDPRKHGWADVTSGHLEISQWYGMHSLIVDLTIGSVLREHALSAIENMIE